MKLEGSRILITRGGSGIGLERARVEEDWSQARKYFSLSEKYSEWRNFTMPARGIVSTHSSSRRTSRSA